MRKRREEKKLPLLTLLFSFILFPSLIPNIHTKFSFFLSQQALLAGPEDAAEYGEDVIDPGSRVLPDMALDDVGAHLFILTTTKVCKH